MANVRSAFMFSALCLASAAAFGQSRQIQGDAPLDRAAAFPFEELIGFYREANSDYVTTNRLLEGGEFNVNIRHIQNATPDNFRTLVHENTIDVWVVQEGSGTLVTGGTREGDRYVGGEERFVTVGDVVFIPAGVPHGVKEASAITWLNIRFPEHRQRAESEVFDSSYVAPRTPHGDPDLQGVWSNAVLTPLERPEELADKATLTQEEAEEYARRRVEATNRDQRTDDSDADVANAYNDFWWDSGDNVVRTRRTSLIIDPPNGRLPPLTAAAQQRLAARRPASEIPAGPEDLGLSTRCIHFSAAGPPMLPSAYNNNYQIVQTEDHVLLVNEMVHEARIIPLDGRDPLPDGIRQWLGSSRGHWDGDTLVVETTNRRDDTSLRGSGMNMHLTERFTRVADDVLLYEFTVDDPENFTRPWTAQIPSVRADGIMYEYACHEGNRGMTGILAGARAAEAAEQAQ